MCIISLIYTEYAYYIYAATAVSHACLLLRDATQPHSTIRTTTAVESYFRHARYRQRQFLCPPNKTRAHGRTARSYSNQERQQRERMLGERDSRQTAGTQRRKDGCQHFHQKKSEAKFIAQALLLALQKNVVALVVLVITMPSFSPCLSAPNATPLLCCL